MGARRRTTICGRRGHDGFALTEILVAVAVASVWVLAIVIGLLVVTTADASTSSRQRIATALFGASEAIKELPYLTCGGGTVPTAAAYESVVAASVDRYEPPEGITVTVTEVEYWDRDGAVFVAACPSSDGGVQRLSLRAADGDGRDGTTQVVKAEP